MDLQTKSVTKKLNEYSEIKALMNRAFPKNEQNPMWLLNYWEKKDGVEFLAYYDDDILCGFTFTVAMEKTVFVMYIAVSDKIRSKGYGSTILSLLKKRYPDSEIALNIETLDKDADNYEQRVKRFSFYERNGFFSTDKNVKFGKNEMLILSTNKNFDEKAYTAILRKLSFGLYKPQIVPVEI